jgi:diguanylate cyclase (GGDEF)-like protein/PAS domain S-box-containing protein
VTRARRKANRVLQPRRAQISAAVFLAILAGVLSYNVFATQRERANTLAVNVAARQQVRVEQYANAVVLRLDGLPADPRFVAGRLVNTADALLDGGDVLAVQGNDRLVHIQPELSWRARRKLEEARNLSRQLVAKGDALMATGIHGAAAHQAELQELEVLEGQLSSVTRDAVGEMTQDAEDSLLHLAKLEALLGLLALGAAVALGMQVRKGERDRSAARFRSLVHHSSDLITLTSADDVVLYQSPSVERVLGHRPDNVVARPVTTLVHPQDIALVRKALHALRDRPGQAVTIECRLAHADGSWVQTEATVSNLVEDPSIEGFVWNTRDITERKALEVELIDQAFHDSLTGLANRALFQDRLEHAVSRARRDGRPLAVLFLDLDGFKTVNDSLGHVAGDMLLCEAADRLRKCVRPGDTVARFGGDEFALLLDEWGDDALAVEVAERALEQIREPFRVLGQDVFVDSSIGIAFTSLYADGADELLRNADLAMYAAKGAGKGRFQVFEPRMHEHAVERLEMQASLQRAVERDELSLVFQPTVQLETGAIEGAEALVRWDHPNRGLLKPDVFIPLAEEAGVIVPLGNWVLREACRVGRTWQDRSTPFPLSINVNVSGRQLHEASFVDEVARALDESGLDPQRLVLEITESTLVADAQAVIGKLHCLKALGIRLAIDDFGTGYSSLSYLRKFPVDILKIDKSFVDSVLLSPVEGPAFMRAIVNLGLTLQMRVVAEGIEYAGQLEQLRRAGCHSGQGNFFSLPVDAEAMDLLLDGILPISTPAPAPIS